jgi:signal transduction histidine kinase
MTDANRQFDALQAENFLLKERLAETQRRLDEATWLRSELLATMSHELLTPLHAILGFSTMLLAGRAGDLNPAQQRQIGFINASGDHLMALTDDLLDLSRIDAGTMDLTVEDFDFADVVTEVEAIAAAVAAQKQLRLVAELQWPSLPMRGDSRKCFRVVFNLVSNAVRFTRTGEVRFSAALTDDTLRIEIVDTGGRIAADKLLHLAEPLDALDGGRRRRHDGTGVGTYLTRRLTYLMGGRIEVQANGEIGSRLVVVLPRDSAGAAPRDGAESPGPLLDGSP